MVSEAGDVEYGVHVFDVGFELFHAEVFVRDSVCSVVHIALRFSLSC